MTAQITSKTFFEEGELDEFSTIKNFLKVRIAPKNLTMKYKSLNLGKIIRNANQGLKNSCMIEPTSGFRIVYCYLPWVYTHGYSHCILSGFSAQNHEGGLI